MKEENIVMPIKLRVWKNCNYMGDKTDNLSVTDNLHEGWVYFTPRTYPHLHSEHLILETESEYIWLNDKNGKEMYRGDIVKFEHPETKETASGVIMLDDGTYKISVDTLKGGRDFIRMAQNGDWDFYSIETVDHWTFEVIGDIWNLS